MPSQTHAMTKPGPITRRTLLLLALFTLVFFGGGGAALIHFVQHRELDAVILGSRGVFFQIATGTAAGMVIAFVAAWLIDRPWMRAIKLKYARLIGPLLATPADILFVSLCAGIGEELFFRGAMQHWLGIPLTAVLFVAIHGYLDPRSWRMCIYGVTLTFGMMVLGWMASAWGLVAPMAAHTAIDVVLLAKLARGARRAGSTGNGFG